MLAGTGLATAIMNNMANVRVTTAEQGGQGTWEKKLAHQNRSFERLKGEGGTGQRQGVLASWPSSKAPQKQTKEGKKETPHTTPHHTTHTHNLCR